MYNFFALHRYHNYNKCLYWRRGGGRLVWPETQSAARHERLHRVCVSKKLYVMLFDGKSERLGNSALFNFDTIASAGSD